MGAREARTEAALRLASSGYARKDIRLQFLPGAWNSPCQVFGHLAPDTFGWIEFRGPRRKGIDMEARMASDEVLYRLALVNGVLVPDQYEGARHMLEQVRKKSQHFLAAQIAWVRVDTQAKFDPGRRDKQRPQQMKAHAMRETGVDDGRLSLRCPGALERRDQREAAFVLKHQGGMKLAPFFLSGANDSVSTAPRRARRAAGGAAGVFANSSPSASTHARPHWEDSASQTNATANGRCGRASSNLRRSPELPPHLPTDAVSGLPGVG
jgi:hypothetical protein